MHLPVSALTLAHASAGAGTGSGVGSDWQRSACSEGTDGAGTGMQPGAGTGILP